MSTETNEALETLSTDLETPDAPEIGRATRTAPTSAPCGNVGLGMLLEQAAVSSELGTVFEDGLLIGGWTPADTEGLKQDRLAFSKAYSEFHQKCDASKEATAAHRALLAESVLVRNRLVTALAVVTDGARSQGWHPARLNLSGTRKSASLLGQWFHEMCTEVRRHRPALARLLKEDPVQLAQSQRNKLEQAVAHHDNQLMDVPYFAEEQHAARVKLASAIARQQRAAAFAFAGNEEVLRRFVPCWSKKLRRRAKQPTLPLAAEAAHVDAGAQAALPEAPMGRQEQVVQHATSTRK